MLVFQIGKFCRLGNLINAILNSISANILLYKHNKISLSDIKNKNNIVLKNFPDYFLFKEYDDNVDNNNIINVNIFINYYSEIDINTSEHILDVYIKPYIDYNYENILNIDFDNDLIIHIRSGDIFYKNSSVNKDPNSNIFMWFLQPPYSFYKKIIDENKYSKIYIISECYNNPIIEKLINNYKNIIFVSNDINNDFKILLNSKNLVVSTSDFVLTSVYLSKQKNVIYCSRPSYLYKVDHKFNVNKYDYSNYYNQSIGSLEEKIELMLNS